MAKDNYIIVMDSTSFARIPGEFKGVFNLLRDGGANVEGLRVQGHGGFRGEMSF